jgi:hypothetical protein
MYEIKLWRKTANKIGIPKKHQRKMLEFACKKSLESGLSIFEIAKRMSIRNDTRI